jgi:uncharacterized phage-associated protein
VTVSVHDVAAYILAKQGGMSAMKLQKLCYYSQAWHLVWDEEPLYRERIEAWANGPVAYELFDAHRGQFSLGDTWTRGNAAVLTPSQRETIDIVLEHYGKLTGQALSAMTHAEDPWRDARKGLSDTARSNAEITHAAMADFYSALAQSDDDDVMDEHDWEAYYEADAEMAREYEAELAAEYERDMYEPDPRDFD